MYLTGEYYPYYKQHKLSLPLIIQRQPIDSGFLPLTPEYFFSENDSIVRAILYDWEFDNYNFNGGSKEIRNEDLNYYQKEYERIKKNLLTEFSTPVYSDTSAVENTSDRGKKFLTKTTIFDTDLYYASLYMIYGSSTHRIRFNFFWKD